MGEPPEDLQGAELLVSVFGYWPSFHDAEVLRFSLDRGKNYDAGGPIVDCTVYVFEMTSEVSPEGYYVCRKHSLVTFRFMEVFGIELSDFDQQNALWALEIVNIAERQLERVKFNVKFAASWGMDATFQCFAVELLSVEPCDEDGNAIDSAV